MNCGVISALNVACFLKLGDQAVMFDLPLVDKAEIQALLKADVLGGGKRTAR